MKCQSEDDTYGANVDAFFTFGYLALLLVYLYGKANGKDWSWRQLIVPSMLWFAWVYYTGTLP